MDADSPWHEWAVDQLQNCSEQAPLHINLLIYTELLIPGPDVEALNAMLDVYDTLRSPLSWACAALALYRLRREKLKLYGGHAVSGLSVGKGSKGRA